MENDIYYNTKNTSFADKGAFNNAILLLSLVKAEYYYITGFSRPNNQIEIGFDLDAAVYGKASQCYTVDFTSDVNHIRVFARLQNIVFENETQIPIPHSQYFILRDGAVDYERCFPKDTVIPMDMKKLNTVFLSVKKELLDFTSAGIAYLLKKKPT